MSDGAGIVTAERTLELRERFIAARPAVIAISVDGDTVNASPELEEGDTSGGVCSEDRTFDADPVVGRANDTEFVLLPFTLFRCEVMAFEEGRLRF